MKTADEFFQSAQHKWLTNDTKGAKAELEQALALDPDNPAYYLERGNIHIKEHNYGQALRDFSLAIEKNAEGAVLYSALSQRAICHGAFEQFNDLINDLSLIINNNLQNSNTYAKRADYYLHFGDPEKSIADYTSAYQLDPDNHVHLLNRAQAYFKIERYHEAIKDLDELLMLEDSDHKFVALTHFWRGKTYFKLNDTEKALADFNRMAKIRGSNITFVDPVDCLRLIDAY
jgi:tetratricopeptide (TPR) repeat protein